MVDGMGDAPMIGIRADANEIVATGHIMRCITIAKEIRKQGEEVVFFLADEYGVPMLQENGYEYVILNSDWANPMEEIGRLSVEIKKWSIAVVLFDSYRMTKDYFADLRKKVPEVVTFAYIDDLFEEIYPVDILINYNAYHTQFPYEKVYSEKTKLCLGPSYVPLREEFGKAFPDNGSDNSVLLSCGGGDALQSLYGILERAVKDARFNETKFHVVVGRYHQKKEVLESLAKEQDNIVLHHNVSRMAELMESCQIAVSAAGTMLYELCAMERPTVFFITADNQRYDSDFFAENDRMLFAGDFRAEQDICIGRILDGMDMLLNNVDLRNELKEKLRMVTDGKGAGRIADVLIKK